MMTARSPLAASSTWWANLTRIDNLPARAKPRFVVVKTSINRRCFIEMSTSDFCRTNRQQQDRENIEKSKPEKKTDIYEYELLLLLLLHETRSLKLRVNWIERRTKIECLHTNS
jgi:hypothetical protein